MLLIKTMLPRDTDALGTAVSFANKEAVVKSVYCLPKNISQWEIIESESNDTMTTIRRAVYDALNSMQQSC